MTDWSDKMDIMESLMKRSENSREFFELCKNKETQKKHYWKHREKVLTNKQRYYHTRLKKVNDIISDLNIPE